MTKVEVEYLLESPIDDRTMEAIARAHSVYGLRRVSLTSSMDRLAVTYDASRLQLPDVDRALHSSGLNVTRRP
jgi:hypothetical protein